MDSIRTTGWWGAWTSQMTRASPACCSKCRSNSESAVVSGQFRVSRFCTEPGELAMKRFILPAVGIALMTVAAVAQQPARHRPLLHFSSAEGSEVRVDGDSSLHKWTVKGRQ